MSQRQYLAGHLRRPRRFGKHFRQIRNGAKRAGIFLVVAALLWEGALFLFPADTSAASLPVASATYDDPTTDLTTINETYTDTGVEIASGSLPAGTYFVSWGAGAAYGSNGNTADVRLVRGTATEIAETIHESGTATSAVQGPSRSGYWLGTLSGSERLAVQFQGHGSTVFVNSVFIKALRLDANLTVDDDYFTSGSQESSTPELTSSGVGIWETVKTLTKTFSNFDTEDYLLFASMEIMPNDAGGANECLSRVVVDGSPIMESQMEAEDPKDRHGYTMAKLVSLGTGSKSISLQGQSLTAATCSFSRSRIYMFRASAFDQVLENYSSGESTTNTATWDDKNSQAYTPNQSETVMVLGSHARGSAAGNCSIATRINDGTNTYGFHQGYMPNNAVDDYFVNMTAASMTVSSATTFSKQFQRASGACVAKIKESTLIVWSMTVRDDTTMSMSAYRWFTNGTTPLTTQDTPYTLSTTGEEFRLRLLLHVANNDLPTGSQNFKLQFAPKSGTCDTSYTGETFSDVGPSSGDIRFHDNAGITDGSPLTPTANDPTHGSDTVAPQTYEESNNFTSISRIDREEDGEWEFSLVDFSAPASTSYCFRVVLADGSTIATPGVVPEITTAGSANLPPNNPDDLTQMKTTDVVLATGAWTNETSGGQPTIKFTATVSDPDASDTLQLCVEIEELGTGFTNTEDACGTGVSYVGTPLTASVTLTNVADSTEFHWQARVKDAGGLYSSWVSYGDNPESARDFGTDTIAPTGGTVYDGNEPGVDKTFSDSSLSALSANWDGFDFSVSQLQKYEYAIGTTQGGNDVKDWTDNSTNTSVTATGLTLQTSEIYYVSVRAYDNANNVTTRSSNGQLVAPSVSFSVSPSTLTFNSLNAGNSYTDTQTTTLTTSTNAYGGYVIRLAANDFLRGGGHTIPDFNGGTYALPDSWQSGDTGFGYTSSDTDIQGVNKFQPSICPGGNPLTGAGCYAPYSQTKPGDIVADHTTNVSGSPITNEQFTITHRATVPSSQAAALYSAILIYTLTALY